LVVAVKAVDEVDVIAPWVSNRIDAESRIAAAANAWAALHGVALVVDPAPRRLAHPIVESAPGSDTPEPTVTIGVPVHNGERYLELALDSIIGQTFGDFELILCDNGSSDATPRICEAYAAQDERISYLRSDINRGPAWNFNRSLDSASGRYFKWAAHDDLLEPAYLERCVEVLDRAPESVVLAYPRTVLIDERGHRLGPYRDGLDLRYQRPHRRLRHLTGTVVMSNAVFGLIRTDALRATRGHGTYVFADHVLLAELALRGQFWEVPEPLFLRRHHRAMSIMVDTSPAALAEWFRQRRRTDQTTAFERLFDELLSAIERAPLSPSDRALVYAAGLPPWFRHSRVRLVKELARTLGSPRARASTRGTEFIPGDVAAAEQVVVRDSIRAVVRRVAPDFVPHIRLEADPQLEIAIDRATFEAIVANLVSNAVRYGAPPIVISATREAGLTITVRDFGRGVSEEFAPHLFEAFSRSETSRKALDGLGLGLAVSRLGAQALGGSLTHRHTTPGACFELTLPSGVVVGSSPAYSFSEHAAVTTAPRSGGQSETHLRGLEKAA
jgi:glycosyltransferase involved in cell wall biosynthesis